MADRSNYNMICLYRHCDCFTRQFKNPYFPT